MKEIAKEFQVDWDTKKTEQELLKPQEQTIDGPRAFVCASSLPVKRASDESIDPTKAVPRSSSSMSISTHYHDTESAAEAAAELAKQAVEAAQAAGLLANREDHYHPGSTRPSRDSETSSSYYAENRGICRRHSCNDPCVNEPDHEEEAGAKETARRRRSYNNSPPLPPPPATSEFKFDESDYEEETEPEEGPSQSRASSLPPNREPPQAPQSDESRRDSSGRQVHPKLPDYDTLAARFEAIRNSKGPLI